MIDSYKTPIIIEALLIPLYEVIRNVMKRGEVYAVNNVENNDKK